MPIFKKSSEASITKAIVKNFTDTLLEYVESDVIVIGAGPSGLVAAMTLAEQGVRVLIAERNNFLGGGYWIGGYMMNPITVRAPAQKILDKIGCPYKEVEDGLFVAAGPHACSKTIAAACDAGVKFLNFTNFEDVVLRENGRVAGAVLNWTLVEELPKNITCADPIPFESKFVIDATGHDAFVVEALTRRGLKPPVPGHSGMWITKSEDSVVEYTGLAHPGLVVSGMAVATTYGLPRMGPTFGAMLLSGEKAGNLIARYLRGKIDESEMRPTETKGDIARAKLSSGTRKFTH
jgi:thiamine thiazole synthase